MSEYISHPLNKAVNALPTDIAEAVQGFANDVGVMEIVNFREKGVILTERGVLRGIVDELLSGALRSRRVSSRGPRFDMPGFLANLDLQSMGYSHKFTEQFPGEYRPDVKDPLHTAVFGLTGIHTLLRYPDDNGLEFLEDQEGLAQYTLAMQRFGNGIVRPLIRELQEE